MDVGFKPTLILMGHFWVKFDMLIHKNWLGFKPLVSKVHDINFFTENQFFEFFHKVPYTVKFQIKWIMTL